MGMFLVWFKRSKLNRFPGKIEFPQLVEDKLKIPILVK